MNRITDGLYERTLLRWHDVDWNDLVFFTPVPLTLLSVLLRLLPVPWQHSLCTSVEVLCGVIHQAMKRMDAWWKGILPGNFLE